MFIVQIVGRKNHGKTTLVLELLQEFRKRGLRVGTVKHTGHEHELDTPGKDSHRHRMAGGYPAAVLTHNLAAVYLDGQNDWDAWKMIEPLYQSCDVVLVEGFAEGPGIKIEVWRQCIGTQPMAQERDDIVAICTNDTIDLPCPVWSRNDLDGLAEKILAMK